MVIHSLDGIGLSHDIPTCSHFVLVFTDINTTSQNNIGVLYLTHNWLQTRYLDMPQIQALQFGTLNLTQ